MANRNRKRNRRAAPGKRKADESDAKTFAETGERLAAWLRSARFFLPADDAKLKAAALVQALIVHIELTILPARGLLDGERPAEGPGSGWSGLGQLPSPNTMGLPASVELSACEAELHAGGFSHSEISALTDPNGTERVAQRLRRWRRKTGGGRVL
jgi:hypothetical protein